MTISDFVEAGLIKDSDRVVVANSVCGTIGRIKGNNWFDDRILDVMNAEIYSARFSVSKGWYFSLDRE